MAFGSMIDWGSGQAPYLLQQQQQQFWEQCRGPQAAEAALSSSQVLQSQHLTEIVMCQHYDMTMLFMAQDTTQTSHPPGNPHVQMSLLICCAYGLHVHHKCE